MGLSMQRDAAGDATGSMDVADRTSAAAIAGILTDRVI